jgi:uncharacterized membrane protein
MEKTIITQTSLAILYVVVWAYFFVVNFKYGNKKERPRVYWSLFGLYSFGVATGIYILILVICGDFRLANWPKLSH